MILVQFLVNGIAAGAEYSLLSLGFALIYNSTRIFHIAHGVIFTFGAYVFYIGVVVLGWPLVVAAALAIAAATALGILTEGLLYAPIRRIGGGGNSMLIASLGLTNLLQAVYALIFGTDTLTVLRGTLPGYNVAGVTFTILHLVIFGTSIVLFTALHLFLTRSRYGKAIRALVDDPRLAAAQGIDARRLFALIFGLGSALAGVGAVLFSLDLGVRPDMGFTIVFIAVVAVVVGGIGYLPGALAGAFLLGILQQMSVWVLDSAWQSGIVFLVLMAFLAVRPSGLFGARFATRQA